jgi:hypothetical protein
MNQQIKVCFENEFRDWEFTHLPNVGTLLFLKPINEVHFFRVESVTFTECIHTIIINLKQN